MREETWQRLKEDMPIIFLATFVAIVANYGFNQRILDITNESFWANIIIPIILLIIVAIGIGYFILWIFYKIFKN